MQPNTSVLLAVIATAIKCANAADCGPKLSTACVWEHWANREEILAKREELCNDESKWRYGGRVERPRAMVYTTNGAQCTQQMCWDAIYNIIDQCVGAGTSITWGNYDVGDCHYNVDLCPFG